MEILLRILTAVVLLTASVGVVAAQDIDASLEDNMCVMCHGTKDLWDAEKMHLFVPIPSLANDAHWSKGVLCNNCHGGDPSSLEVREAHATESGFRKIESPADRAEFCGRCHLPQATALRKSVHHAVGDRNELGAGTPLQCAKCHGEKSHGMVAVKDPTSPVFLDHQVRTCGECHPKYLDTYNASVHGQGLRESGLLVTAVCSDCHGAHDIYYAADRRSSLHVTRVADTCGKCHAFLAERIAQSIHGGGDGLGTVAEHTSPGGKSKRKPTCVDCHQGHDQPHPDSAGFRLQLPHRCGNCHVDYAVRYGMSLHGQLSDRGYEPAAECADCHGAHDILPVSNPASRLSPDNRQETCRQCHPYAVRSLTSFDPHANFKDAENYPGLYHLYHWTQNALYLFLGAFLLHGTLWFTRSLIYALRYGGHTPLVARERAVIRYGAVERLLYLMWIVSFLGLALTGLCLKYSGQSWAQEVGRALGGFESTRVWHHFFALVVLVASGVHIVQVVKGARRVRDRETNWKHVLLGPDSPVPNRRDARDFLGMIRWFFGLDHKPGFERWTYWEKFDYWALYLAVFLIAGSGFCLWFPNFFSALLGGRVLNAAFVTHSEMALLLAGSLFLIHLFNTHLRPEKFPLDLSALTGVVSEDHLRRARPEYLQRLEREGNLERVQTVAPSRKRLRWVLLLGSLVIVVGLFLLALSLVAFLGN